MKNVKKSYQKKQNKWDILIYQLDDYFQLLYATRFVQSAMKFELSWAW